MYWIDVVWDLVLCCVCLLGSAGVELRGFFFVVTFRCVYDMFDGL